MAQQHDFLALSAGDQAGQPSHLSPGELVVFVSGIDAYN